MKLVGHRDAVASVSVQATLPQIVSSSFDRTVRLWDLVAGRCVTTLTHHRNAVRANVIHPRENTFAAASADVVNKYAFPDGRFVHPFAVVNARFSWVHAMALGGLAEDVLACGCDDGQVVLSDWRSGNVTEVLRSPPQPGSLASEQSIFSVAFDRSGSRLITGEADKSIKVYGLMT
jgi:pleiotropic regulator 1